MNLFRRLPALGALLLVVVCTHAVGATLSRAVIADPIRDEKYPAFNRQLLIPSGGVGMNALLMRAAGKGPKPTLVLLHGLPGNEQNLDLAQAVRRAGWNVLTMHYRGSWGSPGNFSIEGAIQDAEAAMVFLRLPENATRFNINTGRVFVGGHSMGGLAAALYAAAHPDVAGLLLIDAWNAGSDGKDLLAHPDTLAALLEGLGDDMGNSLTGTDPARLAEEMKRHANDWDLMMFAPALAIPPTLVIGATRGGGAENKALADVIRAQHKRRISSLTIDSDHSFADHRIALSAAVVNWLQRQTPTKP
ncbi:alpha/beta hydrolase family protein [Duganella sp. S19_KUP01_CR8]|uniref:alpha/beta hydrolase family protein n=1 Tax=Duganella sp. S19_KUP01_CR8 TaxID=3025502 RepID=UPI002FCD87E0